MGTYNFKRVPYLYRHMWQSAFFFYLFDIDSSLRDLDLVLICLWLQLIWRWVRLIWIYDDIDEYHFR